MKKAIRTIQLKNRCGLHMRPAAEIARIACAHEAAITLIVNDSRADARSLFELLILGVSHGQLLQFTAHGRDAETALNALSQFLESYRDDGEVEEDSGIDSFAA